MQTHHAVGPSSLRLALASLLAAGLSGCTVREPATVGQDLTGAGSVRFESAAPFALRTLAEPDFPSVTRCHVTVAEGRVRDVRGDTVILSDVGHLSVAKGRPEASAKCPDPLGRVAFQATPAMAITARRLDGRRSLWAIVGALVVVLGVGAIGASQL